MSEISDVPNVAVARMICFWHCRNNCEKQAINDLDKLSAEVAGLHYTNARMRPSNGRRSFGHHRKLKDTCSELCGKEVASGVGLDGSPSMPQIVRWPGASFLYDLPYTISWKRWCRQCRERSQTPTLVEIGMPSLRLQMALVMPRPRAAHCVNVASAQYFSESFTQQRGFTGSRLQSTECCADLAVGGNGRAAFWGATSGRGGPTAAGVRRAGGRGQAGWDVNQYFFFWKAKLELARPRSGPLWSLFYARQEECWRRGLGSHFPDLLEGERC